jgi:hypothetical protein
MRRTPVHAVIAAILAVYGLYIASYIPPLIDGGDVPAPLLFAGFLLQACAAFLAAVAVWNAAAWAPGAVVMLGIAIAATEIMQAFVLGVIPFDHALLVAVVALVLTVFVAAYIRRPRLMVV